MDSPFDNIRNIVFETTKNVFGYQASWTSTDGSVSWSGKVHFKNPTEEVRLQAVEYDVSDWQMEYKEGDFPGLFDLVERRGPVEVVTISGRQFQVKEILQVFDGATYRAALNPVN